MLPPTKGKAMLIVGESLSPSESKMEMKNNISGSFREQIRSAKRTGRPVPKYLEKQMVREKA